MGKKYSESNSNFKQTRENAYGTVVPSVHSSLSKRLNDTQGHANSNFILNRSMEIISDSHELGGSKSQKDNSKLKIY